MTVLKEGYYIFKCPRGIHATKLIKVGKFKASTGYYDCENLFNVEDELNLNVNGFHHRSLVGKNSNPVEEYFNTDDPKIKPIVEHYFRHYCSDVIYDKLVKGD